MIFDNVKRLCEKNKISISKLENECGLGNATIKGWKNSSPTVETIKKVADFFGVTVNELITEKGEEQNTKQIEQTISSLEVAEMLGKTHYNLLRSIASYEKHFTELNFELSSYFQPSTYTDGSGKENKCYNITKKGCEFIAHKMTGIKGTEFTVKYIERFHEMEEAIVEIADNNKQLTNDEIVDWKLNDLHKRVKALEKEQSQRPQIGKLHRLTPRKDTWYEKNRNRIWRIRYDRDIELKELYHIILDECSKYYDLDEAEQIYQHETGCGLAYPIDVVEHFPQLQDIANQVLDYYESN